MLEWICARNGSMGLMLKRECQPQERHHLAAATSAGVTSVAELPQLVRSWLMTAAIWSSLSCAANGGIGDEYATPSMTEPCLPWSTVSMCSVGSSANTTALPTSGGNAPVRPRPVAWWQAEQLPVKVAAPNASSQEMGAAGAAAGVSGAVGGVAAFWWSVHRNINLALDDPSLSFEQIIFSNAIGIMAMSQMAEPLGRALLSLSGMVSIVYAASGLSRKRLLMAMAATAVMSMAMIAWVLAREGDPARRAIEYVLLAVMIGTLLQLCLFGSVAAALRAKIRDRNAELDEALARLGEMNAQLARERDNAARNAMRDGLTGIFNRRQLDIELQMQAARGDRNAVPMTVAFIDVDRFKLVNDRYGHAEGDQILKRVADIVSQCIRVTDIFGRYGGDEFMLVMPDTTLENAHVLCERIRASVYREFNNRQRDADAVRVTVSGGIAQRLPGEPLQQLLGRADAALYAAKAAGRNRMERAADGKETP